MHSQITDSPRSQLATLQERPRVARVWQQWVRELLPTQASGESRFHGAFVDPHTGWHDGRHNAFLLARLIAVRCWSEWIDTDLRALDAAIRRCFAFVGTRQHADGRLEMNGVYSAIEAGFTLPGLAAAYSRLDTIPGDALGDLRPPLRNYLLSGAQALLDGEAHTANHRWAAAAAPLAAVHRLWPDERYLAKIESYLADGIDCDPHGCWYQERSPGYSMVANHGMMVLADCLGRPELLEHVVRSVQFAANFMQPNGETDTSFSHRQDRGRAGAAGCTYSAARRAAQITGDGRFTTLAELAWHRKAGVLDALMPLLFEIDEHPEPLPDAKPLDTQTDLLLPERCLARRRDDQTGLTLAADPGGHFFDTVRDQWGGPRRSEDWFHLHHRGIVIQSIRLAVAGMGAIQPESLERERGGDYMLAGSVDGWTHTLHFRPASPKVHVPWDLRHTIRISYEPHLLRLRISCSSPHAIVAQLRLYVRPGIAVTQGPVHASLGARQPLVLPGGSPLTLSSGDAAVRVEGLPPAFHALSLGNAESIPSAVTTECACLSLGLNMPVNLDLNLRLT